MTDLLAWLREMSAAPSTSEAFNTWLEAADAVAFLKANASEDEIVIYAGTRHVFIHGVLVSASLVSPPDIEDLMDWSFNAASSWGISYSLSEPSSIWISPPLERTRSKTIDQGEQLIFARFFEGRLGQKEYFEVLQKFVHVFDLHFVAERNAYCRLDKRGDIEDVVRFVTLMGKGNEPSGTVVAFRRGLLDEYMALTGSALVLTFDFARFRPSPFHGWDSGQKPTFKMDGDLFYRLVIQPGYASYLRGCQVVKSKLTKEEIYNQYTRSRHEGKEYASFIAYDWKNGVVKEISCAPGATANYFTKSDLPFETSPAFFRPEVLLKYKADSEKYHLGERSITCRGAWHLKTYDINEAGQVHTYLVYLRDLPYEEQLHWKAYNEQPKAPLSRRAITTDFKGEWDLEYDPLQSVKYVAGEIGQKQVPWWTLSSEQLVAQVHYPVTSSADEWANELLLLDQLLVEGFEDKWLRKKATALGREPDLQLRSLKLIEECLMALGFDEDHARRITAPLQNLHYLRSKLKGHASGEEAVEIKKQVLSEHGSYKNHFRVLCGKCDEAFRTIHEVFDKAERSS